MGRKYICTRTISRAYPKRCVCIQGRAMMRGNHALGGHQQQLNHWNKKKTTTDGKKNNNEITTINRGLVIDAPDRVLTVSLPAHNSSEYGSKVTQLVAQPRPSRSATVWTGYQTPLAIWKFLSFNLVIFYSGILWSIYVCTVRTVRIVQTAECTVGFFLRNWCDRFLGLE